MEQQQSTKNTVSDRMSRVFTKKRTLGLAACLALVLIAGGGASYYHHAPPYRSSPPSRRRRWA